MSKSIDTIEGIGPAYKTKLVDAGIKTVEGLLEKGCDPKGRKELADTCGFSEKVILDWVNMADLFRVNGIAGQFAELLKASGVDTVKELATRNAENLWEKLKTTNEAKNLTKVVPDATKLQGFIDQAKDLPKMVSH